MNKKPALNFKYYIDIKGDWSVGIPDTSDIVEVKVEYGLNDDELNQELDKAIKQTLLDFYGADMPCTILNEKEYLEELNAPDFEIDFE